MCHSERCCNLKLLYMSVGLSLYIGTIVSIKLKPMLGENVAEFIRAHYGREEANTREGWSRDDGEQSANC